MEKEEGKRPLLKPSLVSGILLSAWMAAMLFLFLLFFGPPIFWEAASLVGAHDSLSALRGQLMPFFQTSDYSPRVDFR